MGEYFGKIKILADAFYEGWRHSILNGITIELYDRFVKEVEEPFNQEATRLRAEGVSEQKIDEILNTAKLKIWKCSSMSELMK